MILINSNNSLKVVEMTDETQVPKPPYGAYRSVKNFIVQLGKTVYPPHIDREMMAKQSGQSQTEILSALRFLGCIDAKGNTLKPLESLKNSLDDDTWQKTFRAVLTKTYQPVLNDVNVSNGSGKQLQDAFKSYTKADGFMLARYIRFYLAALKDAGVEYSPHFKVPKSSVKKKKPASKTETEKQVEIEGDPLLPLDGMIDIKIPFGTMDGLIRVPRGITMDQLAIFKGFAGGVEAMAKQNSDEKPE